MSDKLNYNQLRTSLHSLNTDDTISSAHGLLCGFACVEPDLSLEDWLNEILLSADRHDVNVKIAYESLAHIFNQTRIQLNDATFDFQLLIAGQDARLAEQANTLVEWCQGFLLGLGLQKISTNHAEVFEIIKDFGEISKLDIDLPEQEQNACDLNEMIEFVRMGTLLIQETLQPSKQGYI